MNQGCQKAGSSLPDLPPIIPEWRIPLDGVSPELDGLCNIVGQAYSIVLHAQENQLPREDRCELFSKFKTECTSALAVASNISKACESADRSELYRDYEWLCDKLEILVNKYLLGDLTVPPAKIPLKFVVLFNSQLRWLVKAGLMTSMLMDIPGRALQEWVAKQQELENIDSGNSEGTKSQAENVFKNTGDYWEVRFQGQTKHISNCAGFSYIRLLLREQGRAFTTTEFLSLHTGKPVTLAGGDKQLDEEGKRRYGDRLKDIEEQLQRAKNNNDVGEQENLEDEKAAIITEIEKATGFGKRSKELNPELGKQRISIGNAIGRGIDKIAVHVPKLAEHLRESISNPHSSTSLSYRPSEVIDWVL